MSFRFFLQVKRRQYSRDQRVRYLVGTMLTAIAVESLAKISFLLRQELGSEAAKLWPTHRAHTQEFFSRLTSYVRIASELTVGNDPDSQLSQLQEELRSLVIQFEQEILIPLTGLREGDPKERSKPILKVFKAIEVKARDLSSRVVAKRDKVFAKLLKNAV